MHASDIGKIRVRSANRKCIGYPVHNRGSTKIINTCDSKTST